MDRSRTAPLLDPETWVATHGDYLYRFALARARDPEVAEELVQDALLAALTARHAFRGQCSERSWLTAILKRKAIDWLRAEVCKRVRHEPLPDKWADAQFTRGGKWKKKPDEWSADDVCEAVGASSTNLWVMLHRARLRLWRCLSVNWFGEEPGTPSDGRT